MDKLSREDVAVLIRARQLSRQAGINPDADIKAICEEAGISRKTGYQWADKLGDGFSGDRERELLTDLNRMKIEKERLEKELGDARFEIEGRKLAWEIHRVDELLEEKKRAHNQSEKEKAVRFFRWQEHPVRRIAWILSLPVSTLMDWNKIFDKDMKPIVVPEKRGKACKVTIEVVKQVVEKAQEMEAQGKRIRLKQFTEKLGEDGLILSSKTVSEILTANGLRETSTRKRRPRFYQSLRQRIPNGLLSFDGGMFIINLDGVPLSLNLELGVDVGTFMHTAFSIGSTETTASVLDILQTHIEQWGCPLGIVCDHGSANMSGDTVKYIQSKGIEFVPAGPANPKGNGTLEGAFSQMKQIIGTIHLDTSSPEKLAKSVLDTVVSVYIKMRNKLPLRRKSGSLLENFTRPVGNELVEFERQRLKTHAESRNRQSEDQLKIDRIRFLIQSLKIPYEPEVLKRAEKTITAYSIEAIMAAEKAFIIAVNRKSDRLNLSYFFGILRNIQQKKDDEVYQDHCRRRYNIQQMIENERRMRIPEEKLPTVEQILSMLEKGVVARFRKIREVCLRTAQRYILELTSGLCYFKTVEKKIIEGIGKRNHLSISQKEKMLDHFRGFIQQRSTVESVT